MTDDPKYYKRVNIADYVSSGMTEGEAHMRSFAHAVNTGSSPDTKTMQFFADAFNQILHNSKPDAVKKALKLGTGSGNRKSSEARAAAANKKLKHAVAVEEYIQQGYSKNKAYEQLSSENKGESFDTIKKHHEACETEKKAEATAMLIALQAFEQKRSKPEKE